MFYLVLVKPLELIIELLYGLSYDLFNNPGIAIIPLSLCVNLLCLPLNNRAELLQNEQKEIEKRMSKGVDHINSVFKGDEKFMMLQAYYRINNNNPINSLKSALPLLLEIPFFIAAYHFLSNLEFLNGTSFGYIKDLGKPDGLIRVFGLQLNLYPLLMTLINCLSSYIYLRKSKLKERLQLYMVAVLFLILLYNSPSGLVYYWTINNLFSLFKNIVYKSKYKNVLSFAFLFCLGIMTIFLAFISPYITWKEMYLVVLIGVISIIAALITKFKGRLPKPSFGSIDTESKEASYLYGCFLLFLISGILIPSSVIRSSPIEFISPTNYKNPLWHIVNSSLLSFGFFIIWISIFYFLSENNKRSGFKLLLWILSVVSIVDYFFFGLNLGTLTSQLKYELGLEFSTTEMIVNFELILFLSTSLYIFWIKWKKPIKSIYILLILSVSMMSCINIYQISKSIPDIKSVLSYNSEKKAIFELSKNGNNVIVMMLDRAISAYVPYMFNENSELEKQFDGFTYYPNTLSFGNRTNNGSPSLFGGYEYVPEEINKRDKETLEEKQNEALKVMPVLFYKNGFKVTVCDPPYAGYSWIPDLSIYDDYPEIKKYNTAEGQFVDTEIPEEEKNEIWNRNFFCYSIVKMSPLIYQLGIYQDGKYYDPTFLSNENSHKSYVSNGMSKSTGVRDDFINNFAVLQSLPEMSKISDSYDNTFLMIQNSSTHNNMILKEPSYLPETEVDNTEYDILNADRFTLNGRILKVNSHYQMSHYQVNMASLIQIGNWLDYLRDQGVYDNTRIIIVADHGWPMEQLEDMIFGRSNRMAYNPEDAMAYNPLLLVKNFNSKGFSVDYEFMTNADTPTLAMERVIKNPINPFTKKTINNSEKEKNEFHIMYTDDWSTDSNNGNTFKQCLCLCLSNHNIFDMNNWRLLED